jgi:hypothetical protein
MGSVACSYYTQATKSAVLAASLYGYFSIESYGSYKARAFCVVTLLTSVTSESLGRIYRFHLQVKKFLSSGFLLGLFFDSVD